MTAKFTFTLILIFYSLVSLSVKAQVNTNDSLALVDLYNSTNGSSWNNNQNWLTGPVSTWLGVGLSGNRVTSVRLDVDNLTGSLPSTLSNLSALTYLNLSYNHIGGVLPSSIGGLIMLTYLNLTYNNFTGSIPNSIGNLTNLQVLGLGSVPWGGTIPLFIGKLKKLVELDLSTGQFTGVIPDTLATLTNLGKLDLDQNQLTGTIPASFGKLKAMITLILYKNRLSGELPVSTLQKLTSLRFINISNNRFTLSSNIVFPPFTTTAIIYFNRFTFNGIESLGDRNKFPDVQYQPQARIAIHRHGNTLAVSAGGTLKNNTYTWYKAGVATGTVISGDSVFQPAQSGDYYAAVTNAIATRLTLTTDTFNYVAINGEKNITASSNKVNINNSNWLVYPNPVKNVINIRSTGNATITIANTAGKMLLSKNITGNGVINVKGFASGVYYIHKDNGEVKEIIISK